MVKERLNGDQSNCVQLLQVMTEGDALGFLRKQKVRMLHDARSDGETSLDNDLTQRYE